MLSALKCTAVAGLTVLVALSVPTASPQGLDVSAAAAPEQPGAISGQVDRADTAKPLEGVKVMLGLISSTSGPPFQTTQTVEDGSYTFPDVPPGQYRVEAYKQDFTEGQYGSTRYGGWGTLKLVAGQKVTGINMSLHPLVEVEQMNEEALQTSNRFWISIDFSGSFSPDGKLFAFSTGDQVWLYEMDSQHLTSVTESPANGWPQIRGLAWVADTLYADAYYPNHDRYFVSNAEGGRETLEVPEEAKITFEQRRSQVTDIADNSRFVVTFDMPCHGCYRLTASTTDGVKIYQNSDLGDEGQFVFEPLRSVVLFPEFFYPAVSLLDLNTRLVQDYYLPQRAERLLAATPDATGFFVAYSSYGPCSGYGDQGTFYRIYPARAPYNICFAKLPFSH